MTWVAGLSSKNWCVPSSNRRAANRTPTYNVWRANWWIKRCAPEAANRTTIGTRAIRITVTKLALPDPVAIALAEVVERLAEALGRDRRKRGRPPRKIYREAADLHYKQGWSFRRLCRKFLGPEYSAAGKEGQKRMRDAMRAGVERRWARLSKPDSGVPCTRRVPQFGVSGDFCGSGDS